MHREIRGPEPALRGAPGVEPDARQHDLQDRRVERRRAPFPRSSSSRAEKAVALRTTSKRCPSRKARKRRERGLVLEARHVDARDREALVAKRPGQRLDRRKIVGEIDGAIEDDERARARPAPASKQAPSKRPKALTGAGGGALRRGARSRRRERRGTPPCSQGRPRRNSARSARPRRRRASRPHRGARRGAGLRAAAPV